MTGRKSQESTWLAWSRPRGLRQTKILRFTQIEIDYHLLIKLSISFFYAQIENQRFDSSHINDFQTQAALKCNQIALLGPTSTRFQLTNLHGNSVYDDVIMKTEDANLCSLKLIILKTQYKYHLCSTCNKKLGHVSTDDIFYFERIFSEQPGVYLWWTCQKPMKHRLWLARKLVNFFKHLST